MEQSVQSCCPSSAKGQRDLLQIPLSYPQKQSQIATCRFGNLLFNSQKIFKYHTHRLTYPPTFQSFNLSLSLSLFLYLCLLLSLRKRLLVSHFHGLLRALLLFFQILSHSPQMAWLCRCHMGPSYLRQQLHLLKLLRCLKVPNEPNPT